MGSLRLFFCFGQGAGMAESTGGLEATHSDGQMTFDRLCRQHWAATLQPDPVSVNA